MTIKETSEKDISSEVSSETTAADVAEISGSIKWFDDYLCC